MSPTSTYDRHRPLAGFNVISLAQNLPGPVALAMLVADGVSATKIETPSGDLLRLACPAWYEDLHRGLKSTPWICVSLPKWRRSAQCWRSRTC